MAIEIAPGFAARMIEDPAWIVVNVEADPDLAGEALRQATPDLRAIENAQVFGVSFTHDGAHLVVDAKACRVEALPVIAELVARQVAAVGVRDAVIGAPLRAGGPLTTTPDGYAARSVGAHLIVAPPEHDTELPQRWVDTAARWVRHGLPSGHRLWSSNGTIESAVPEGAVPGWLDATRRRRTDCLLVAGREPSWPGTTRGWDWEQIQADAGERLGDSFRAAWVSSGGRLITQMVLSGGGPASTDEELQALARELADVLRQLSPDIAYAYMCPAVGWTAGLGCPSTDWGQVGGLASYHVNRDCDRFVFDAYHFQVLGPGHLERLGSPPLGSEPLAGGRLGLTIGAFADWCFDEDTTVSHTQTLSERMRDPRARQRGWEVVGPCLARDTEYIPYRPLPPGVVD